MMVDILASSSISNGAKSIAWRLFVLRGFARSLIICLIGTDVTVISLSLTSENSKQIIGASTQTSSTLFPDVRSASWEGIFFIEALRVQQLSQWEAIEKQWDSDARFRVDT